MKGTHVARCLFALLLSLFTLTLSPTITFAHEGIVAIATTPVGQPLQGPTGTERLGGANPSELGYCLRSHGDAIDTYTGNFFRTFSDFAIPGRGIPSNFSRTYNAQAAAQNGPLGYGWTSSYTFSLTIDPTNGIVTVNQENGSTVTFTPNGGNSYIAPSRVLATLTYNVDAGAYTFSRKDQTHYTFNASGQLLREVDRNGYLTSLSYQNGQLASVTDPADRSLTFSYDNNGRIASVTDPISRSEPFQYDQNSNLVTVTDVNGGSTHFSYDANHLLLTITDPNGNVLTNVYDASSRVTSQTDAMQRTTSFSYGDSTTITDPNGNVTVEQYQNAVLVSETRGYGAKQAATWGYTYDPLSLGVTSVTDPNGHAWSQTWDAMGNLLSATDPLSRTTTDTYDKLNDVTSSTDPLAVTTTFIYDSSSNLLSTSRPLQGTKKTQKTRYTYGDQSHPGDITAITDPLKQITSYSYDAAGNLISMTDPLKDITTFQYNGIGWKTAQVTPKKYSTSYIYDAFGDVTLVTDPPGNKTTQQYDANRNLINVTDRDGHLTQYAYNADNELTQVTRADGSLLGYSYDSDGNRTAQIDGLGNLTSYSYTDAAYPHTVTALTDPLKRTTSYGYDPAGNRTSLLDPAGQVTTASYDTANELTGIVYSDNVTPNVSFTYNADGQRARMIDGTGSTNYFYDSLNRLTTAQSDSTGTVAYAYDLKGQLTDLTYPGGQKVSRTYDAVGRLATVKDWLGHTTRFKYDTDSNLVGQVYPNGVHETLQYDPNEQLTTIAARVGKNTFLSFGYTRDKLELLLSMQPKGVPQGNETYGYTPLNQISSVNQPKYQYDHGDNLTQNGPASLSYDTANELLSQTSDSGTTTFSYNARGNRTQRTDPTGGTTSYTYDQANRLTAYGTTAQYVYNGDGLRLSKTVSGQAETFNWDVAEGVPLLLQDGTTQYVTGPAGLPLEQVNTDGTVLYYHQDQLGSTRALTDAQGNVAATYAYDAYGNLTGSTGSVTNPLQWGGHYSDAESGLIYLGTRYYDPSTQQFLSRDLQVHKTQQAYTFAADDPLNLTGILPNTWPPGPCKQTFGWWPPSPCKQSITLIVPGPPVLPQASTWVVPGPMRLIVPGPPVLPSASRGIQPGPPVQPGYGLGGLGSIPFAGGLLGGVTSAAGPTEDVGPIQGCVIGDRASGRLGSIAFVGGAPAGGGPLSGVFAIAQQGQSDFNNANTIGGGGTLVSSC